MNILTRLIRNRLGLPILKFSPIFSFSSQTLPQLFRKPDELLVTQWWSQTPFDANKPLTVPIFEFKTGNYSSENIDLEHKVFNLPLRRDIVHRVYEWRKVLFKKTTHIARTKGTTRGSGKKPFKQKGTGRARQGNKRAPGRYKGGKAFGPKPRAYKYKIPKKVRLLALKSMLSAKLAEGKLKIVTKEGLEEAKTKSLAKILKLYGSEAKILFVTGYKPEPNFEIASQNIKDFEICLPNRISILKLLKADKVIFTKQGLQETTQDLLDRTSILFRKSRKRTITTSEKERKEIFGIKEEKEEKTNFDPSKPLQFKFKILEEYLKEYEAKKKETKEKKKDKI